MIFVTGEEIKSMPASFYLKNKVGEDASNSSINNENEEIALMQCFHGRHAESKYPNLPGTPSPSLLSTLWTSVITLVYFTLYWFGLIHLGKVIYLHLPLRSTSRMVGWLAQVTLPHWIRVPVYRTYGWFFKVNLEEIEHSDNLAYYVSISHFFRRRLKPNVRTIAKEACLVSPSDGCVLSFGIVQAGHLEQVKGVFYTLHGLLGPNTWGQMTSDGPTDNNHNNRACASWEIEPDQPIAPVLGSDGEGWRACIPPEGVRHLTVHPQNQQVRKDLERMIGSPFRRPGRLARIKYGSAPRLQPEDICYAESILLNSFNRQSPSTGSRHSRSFCKSGYKCPQETPSGCQHLGDTALYHLLVYLGPGDYHGFHSPTDWNIFMRRHVPGRLCSVAPLIVNHVSNLYTTNERAIYVGRWQFGFFAFVAVGATTVGSIEVTSDPGLVTNRRQPTRFWLRQTHQLAQSESGDEHIEPSGVRSGRDGGDKTCSSGRYDDFYFCPTVPQTKGQSFGHFNFGSTIILIFEAPTKYFHFPITKGSRVKVGQPLGVVRFFDEN